MPILAALAYRYAQYSGATGPILAKAADSLR
jgi:hypothetical protein